MTHFSHRGKSRVTKRGWIVIAAAWLTTVVGINYILADIAVSCDLRPQNQTPTMHHLPTAVGELT